VKFKTIFLIFNIVLIFSFAIIYFMPLVMLGWDYTRLFWAKNWYLPVIFVAVIAALNVYFIINWKVFHYLEREDWDALIAHIEDRMYHKGRYREQTVKILLNAYLVKSDIAGIERVEAETSEHKPALLPRLSIWLGIPHLLKNEPSDMLAYYGRYLETAPGQDRDWIHWNYAFALMLSRKQEEAKSELVGLASRIREPILKLLTLYLLDSFAASEDTVRELVEKEKKDLKDKNPPSSWEGLLDRGRANVQVVVLTKRVKDARNWLFGTEPGG